MLLFRRQSARSRSVIASKRQERERALASAQAYDPLQHDIYLRADVSTIVANITRGQWTASDVLEAYIARAAFAHQVTNCITEVMFDTARTRARELDEEFAQKGEPLGLLHGVPVSLKDLFETKGYDTSVGFTSWANDPCKSNAAAVDLLIAQGAIPFVKTNIPQTMMTDECANPLWGTTTNPYSELHSPGGSSGGEAALLAMDGSALGFGSDIGGSLRIPATACGIYSLKPSVGRICSRGTRSSLSSFELAALQSVIGPMGRSVNDLEIAARVMLGVADPIEDVLPLPFKEVKLEKKLRFGYYTDDGFVKSSPAVRRAVMEAVAALEREGHECVPFELPFDRSHDALQFFNRVQSADNFKTLLGPLQSDPLDIGLLLLVLPPLLPRWLRAILAWGVETFAKDPVFADLMREARPKSVYEFYQAKEDRKRLMDRFRTEVWNKYGFDGIIAPVQATPALTHGASKDLSPLANATIVYNVLDLPSGVVPVTRVNQHLDVPDAAFLAESSASPLLARATYVGTKPVYDAVKMSGVPIGVQVIGKRWEEENVLAMMKILDSALGARGFGHGAWDAWRSSRT